MQRINSNDNLFHNGDGRSVLGTIVTAEWLNSVQEELVNVFSQLGGKQLNPAKNNQIAELLATQFLLKANLKSPEFTGVPTAPTAALGTNNTQIATTEFVKTAIAALVGSAPAALDTLEELARALAGDANLKATLLAEIGKKANATDFNALHDLFVGIPIPYPLSTIPTGCLAMNGQRFDTRRYPKLAQKYPSGQLPDMRGEFIRGWDNGRGVDAGRGVLSAQSDAIRNITGEISDLMYQNKETLTSDLTARGAFYRDLSARDVSATATLSNTNQLGDKIKFDASRSVPTASDNRPRNIAYHYICLAA